MEAKVIHNVNQVYTFMKNRNRYDYIYQFNNLTPAYWKNVVCFGLYEGSELKEIAMLNINYHIPVLLAACFENEEYNIELVGRIKKFLPPEFYTHMDHTTLKNAFTEAGTFEKEELMNMGLCDYTALDGSRSKEAVRLDWKYLHDIKGLLAASYPDAWLDDDLVKLGKNFGIYAAGKLISFAGIHAYSKKYQVTAVAHVTTHPDYRKKGYGEKTVLALLNDLKGKIEYIGLNVRTDNMPAINCYEKLGFKPFGCFIACEVRNNI